MTWCWHRWDKWSSTYGCLWITPFFGAKYFSCTQERICAKCGKIQYRKEKL